MLPLLILALALARGQDGAATAKPGPPRSLRLLPLGEPPPFRQNVIDGVRYEQEPEAGSIPPRQICCGKGDTAIRIRLNLGRASESFKIPADSAAVLFREASAADDPAAKPWLALHPPETGDMLAVLWRDPGSRWNTPRSLLFADSAAALPAGSLRIVNLLPVEAALIFGPDRLVLTPGKSLVKALSVGTDLPIQVAFKNSTGQYQPFYSGAILLNSNERAQIFIHRADGEKPRQPAKVVTFNEIAPPPPQPKP